MLNILKYCNIVNNKLSNINLTSIAACLCVNEQV